MSRTTQLRRTDLKNSAGTAAKPSLDQIFANDGDTAIADAYGQGTGLDEIAALSGVHYATVSRRLKPHEQMNRPMGTARPRLDRRLRLEPER